MRNKSNLKNKKKPFDKTSPKTKPDLNRFFNTDSRNRAAQPLAASNATQSTWFYCDVNGRIVDGVGREMITYQICTQEYNAQKDPLFVALYKLLLMNKINNRKMICEPVVRIFNALISAALNITSNASSLASTNISTISAANNITLSYSVFNLPVVLRVVEDVAPQALLNGTTVNQAQLLAIYNQISIASGFNIVFGFLKENLSQLNLPEFVIFQPDFLQIIFDKIKAGILQALSQLQTHDLIKQANIAEIFVIIGIVLFSIMMALLLGACVITCGVCVTHFFKNDSALNSLVRSNHEPDADTVPHVTTHVDLGSETDGANAEQPAEMTAIVMPS